MALGLLSFLQNNRSTAASYHSVNSFLPCSTLHCLPSGRHHCHPLPSPLCGGHHLHSHLNPALERPGERTACELLLFIVSGWCMSFKCQAGS